MFKNLIKFNIDPILSKDALKKITWQEQCLVTELFNQYLPSRIREIIPVNDMYLVEWDSEDSYMSFITHDLYKQITMLIECHGVTITFLPETV